MVFMYRMYCEIEKGKLIYTTMDTNFEDKLEIGKILEDGFWKIDVKKIAAMKRDLASAVFRLRTKIDLGGPYIPNEFLLVAQLIAEIRMTYKKLSMYRIYAVRELYRIGTEKGNFFDPYLIKKIWELTK